MQNESPRPRLSGIGGLPQTSLEAALSHVLSAYDVVFRPQLAIGSGLAGMLGECLPTSLRLVQQPGFGVKLEAMLEEDAIAEAFLSADPRATPIAAAQEAFLALLPGFLDDRVLKTQMAGPVTILQSLRDAWSRPLWSDPRLHPVVTTWCARLAEMLASGLTKHATQGLVVLDEPVLGLPGPRECRELIRPLLDQVLEAIRQAGAATGIHCCSEAPCALFEDLAVNDLYIDADRHAQDLIRQAGSLSRQLERGGRLTLGVIPPMPHEGAPRTIEILEALLAAGKLARGDLTSRLSLSASCGTMLMPIERELEIVEALRAERERVESWAKETR